MASDYDVVSDQIRAMTKRLGADDAAFTVMDTIAAVLDAATDGNFGIINTAGQFLYNQLKGSPGPIPNPWFVFNGQEDRPNPISAKYAKSRTAKSVTGTVSSLLGTVASSQTAGINVVSSLMHANSTATTTMHLLKIVAIAKAYPQSRTIAEWCQMVRNVKIAKVSIRGGQLIGGLIPGGSIPTSVIAAVATTGVKLTYTNIIYMAAAGIHWRAFQEQAISGGRGMGVGGAVGPGSRIYWEIFTKRGMTRLLGNYDIAGLVGEPGGWEPLADKLLLI